jgi:colanic acid/amylovoran biosynthesis glycosyltransferase
MRPSTKPKVIIFSDHLLYPSETFIYAQSSALSEFDPIYAGSRRVAGLDFQAEHIYTINHGNMGGKIRELAFKIFGVAPALTKRLHSLNPVLLHAHYGPNGLRALPLARQLGIPLIVTFHGSDVTIKDLRLQRASIGFRLYVANKDRLKKSCALFLAVSKFLRGKLLEQGFPEERVLVHYTGVDTKLFRPASTEKSPVILFVGRFVESKGAEYVIKAAAEVQNHLPATELVLIGEGPLRVGLEKLAKHSLRRYRFLGRRSSDEVCDWMNRASVVCVPSVTRLSGEEEAFGMVCAEALAVGKPVVAFNSGGIPEVVHHESTGLLASEKDWRALARHLFMLLENAELRKCFGQSGRELVLREFDLKHRTRLLERIYAEISSTKDTEPKEGELWRDSVINYSS